MEKIEKVIKAIETRISEYNADLKELEEQEKRYGTLDSYEKDRKGKIREKISALESLLWDEIKSLIET